MRRFVAFDLETAKVLPDGVGDILAFRPLGITCAVAIASDQPTPLVWHGRDNRGNPTSQLSKEEAADVAVHLESLVADGYTIVTWNGLGFDFAVLADESGLLDRCVHLADNHVDMLFQAVCSLGHFISLQKATEGMGLPGKTEGVSGAAAPALWAAGRHSEVIDYCIQDVRATLSLATAAEEGRHLSWITGNGARRRMELPRGWLPVSEARTLPLPDTSWMTDPPTRDRFLRWYPPRGSL